MPQASVLFELSGENPSLSTAEALACLRAESPGFRTIGSGPGFLISECDDRSVGTIAERLALTHRLGAYLGSAPLDSIIGKAVGLDLPKGTLCVRARKVEGSHPELDTQDLIRKVGGALSSDHKIDLTAPDVDLRILISDQAHLFLDQYEIGRKQFDRRKVAERPFFSPISLHPRYARALINLTEVRRGDTVLDPFCGTGGIVLEAAMMGMKALGSDIDPEMVQGCQRNLEHFGVSDATVRVSDIGDIMDTFSTVDAVATDPPYGRAASTKKEEINGLYERGLEAIKGAVVPGGRVGIVLPRAIECRGLELEQLHLQKVHRSLTRHYHVFIRR